jgi:heavy metal sensor kinase
MNPRSLRFRLVVWYAGWLTVLFVVFGIFVYASLRHYLKESLREALARRARQVADLVQRSSRDWPTLGNEIQIHFAPEANNRLTRVWVDSSVTYLSGQPADRSFSPGQVPAPPRGGEGETFDRRVLPDGRALLVVVLTRNLPGRALVVEEGSAETPIQAALHAWLLMLVLGLVFLIFLAVFGGYMLVQRALRPVNQIIHSAERISSRNLAERLLDTRDELEHLSTTLNSMIRRLDEGLQHSQRFLADASHELRTPLTMMQAGLEAVIENTPIKTEVRDFAGSSLEEVERLRRIVEGLFTLSRLDAGEALQQIAPFDLGELATTTTEQMVLLAEDKNIRVTCHTPKKVMVEGDRSRMKQVIVNLLDNAIKYTSRGGRIDVNVTTRARTALLEVSDNGIGIPAKALAQVFERFYRVDKARSRELGGAGLGLSIVKSICTAHNGRVEARSLDGKDSQFIVELPLPGKS